MPQNYSIIFIKTSRMTQLTQKFFNLFWKMHFFVTFITLKSLPSPDPKLTRHHLSFIHKNSLSSLSFLRVLTVVPKCSFFICFIYDIPSYVTNYGLQNKRTTKNHNKNPQNWLKYNKGEVNQILHDVCQWIYLMFPYTWVVYVCQLCAVYKYE